MQLRQKMMRIYKKTAMFLAVFFMAISLYATNYSGTYTVGPTGTLASTLTSAISALATGTLTGPVTLQLQATYVSTGETFPINFTGITTSAVNTVTIEPASGATGLSISSASGTGTIKFNGQAYIYFMGYPGGSPSGTSNMSATNNLTISNTGGGYAIYFYGDANNDKIEYCNIQSENSTAGSGTIFFGTPTAAAGNNNITIDYCNIGSVSSGALAANAIYAAGTASYSNTTITIDHNNIYDYFIANNTSTGINLNQYNTAWTITNNYFFQTYSSATYTQTANVTHYAIAVNLGNAGTNNSYTITGNYIGYNASPPTGTTGITPNTTYYLIGESSASHQYCAFNAIYANVGTTSSTISSNTIQAINVSKAAGNSVSAAGFIGINLAGGAATIGSSAAGNTIGSASSTGSIVYYSNNGSTNYYEGIYVNSSSAVSIGYNTIGGISNTGSADGIPYTFNGIYTTGTGYCTISNNTIGSTSTANSITLGISGTSTTPAQTFYGIQNTMSSNSASTISSNTVQNITTYATSGTGNAFGIYSNTGGSTAQQAITSNTVSTITIGSGNTSANNTFSGICFNTTSGAASFSITSNSVSSITLGASGSTGYNVCYGIDDQNGNYSYVTAASTCSSNSVKTITVYGSSSSGSSIYGLGFGGDATHGSSTLTIQNNTVGGTATNDLNLVAPNNGSSLIGINLPYFGTASTCSNNIVQNMTAGASASITGPLTVVGINLSNGSGSQSIPSCTINSNSILTITSNSTTSPSTGAANYFTVAGMVIFGNNSASSTTETITQNRIVGLVNLANGTGGTSTGLPIAGTYGIVFDCHSGSGDNFSDILINNFIDITLSSSTNGQNPVFGICFILGSGTPTISMYYNTVFLHGSETFAASTTYFYSACANFPTISGGTVKVENNIFLNQITSTNNHHFAYYNIAPGSTNNTASPFVQYNYVEVESSTYYSYSSSSAVSLASWASYNTHDVNSYAVGTVVPSSPSGSISPTALSDVSTGVDLHSTTGCAYDINGYAGGTNGDLANRSTGAGHLGCWEDAGGFYWVGGLGNWSDYANHWVTTTGGSTHTGSAPGQYDNAYFDGNSGGLTCTIDVAATCNNLTCTGYTGLFAGSQTLSIAGNLTFAAGMATNTYSGAITFTPAPSTATTYTINVASETLAGAATFTYTGANAATWQLAAATTINGALTMTKGTLKLNGNTLTLGSSTSPTLTSGVITANEASDVIAFTNAGAITLPTSLFTSNTLTSLTMNGAGGVTVQENWTLTNTLTLTSGVLNIGSNILTLGASGTDMTAVSANTGTSSSWINASNTSGGVKQFVNNNSTTYQFPIGDATHSTPINFNFTSGAASGDYLTVYTTQATMPKFNSSGLSNYLNRYWSVVASGISSPNVAVNYYYNAADIHSSFTKLDPIEQINPATPANPQWVIPSGTVSNVTGSSTWTPTVTKASYKLGTASWTSTSNYISWSGITQLPTAAHSLFGGADDQAAALPIDLVLFTAQPFGKDVLLNWQTASEQDNAYFIIEKTKDGVNFTTVTTVPGAGNSAELLSYAAVDSFPYSGLSYYRLKQTDYDGKYTYSNLAPVNFDASTNADEYVLYPNPVHNGLLNLSYVGNQGNDLVVSFYDVQGRLVAIQHIALSDGAQLVNLYPAQGLKSGIYMVKGVSDSISFVKKVVVD